MFPLAPLGYWVSQTSVAFYYLGSFEMGRWIALSYSRESSRLRDWNQVSCIAGSLLHSLLAAPRKPCFEDCWVCVCRTCHSWTLYDIFLMSKVIKAIFICLVGVQCSVLAAQSCPTLCDPMDCSLPGSSVHGIFPGKNTGVGCHFLLQGIFLTQGWNLGLLHCRSYQGSPVCES